MTTAPPEPHRTGTAPPAVPRLRAMQTALDRWLYHPLARRLAVALAATPVTPNMVSIAGGLLIVAAGVAYVQPAWPWCAIVGLILHMGWHIADGADGDLARMTGRSSAVGEIVDGLADYGGHIILYVTIATAFSVPGSSLWPVVVAAGVSRMVQASYYESQRRQFLHWVHGVAWLRSSGPAAAGQRGFAQLRRLYLALVDLLAPGDPEIDRMLADPKRCAMVRARLEALGPAALAGSALLGANSRTLLLGAAMLAGWPAAYFLYEATLLNLLLAAAFLRAKRTRAALLSGLQTEASSLL